ALEGRAHRRAVLGADRGRVPQAVAVPGGAGPALGSPPMPVLVALVPPPGRLEMAGMAYGGRLGEGWTVQAFREEDDVPDDLAAEVEFVMPAAPQRVDDALLARAPKVRLIQVPGHGFDHVDLEAAARVGV